jgi:hypothetical protein
MYLLCGVDQLLILHVKLNQCLENTCEGLLHACSSSNKLYSSCIFLQQRQFQKAVMVYKSLNGLATDYMHSMFVNRDSVNPYSLRNTENKLAVPKPRTNYLKNSFSYSGAVLWNSLPIGLRQANNLINSDRAVPNYFNFLCIYCYISSVHSSAMFRSRCTVFGKGRRDNISAGLVAPGEHCRRNL